MYSKIVKHIELINTWESEEGFLLDALFINCAKIFQIIYDDLNNNRFIAIAPLLRQIQESLVGILGVYEKVYTMEEFIKNGVDPKTIMKRVKETGNYKNENQFNLLNDLLKSFKSMLNKYSHANFDGLMFMFTDRFKDDYSNQYNRTLFKSGMVLIETVYIIMVKINYKIDIKIPINNLDEEVKRLKSIKYIINKYPESIKEFIMNSPNINEYYNGMFKKIKEMRNNSKFLVKEYNEYFKSE